jgi:outer membrane receptor protein involved in Fe transport
MRLGVIAAVACLSVVGVAAADNAEAAIKKYTNIPAQELGSALTTLARDRGLQVVYLSQAIDSLKTPGAVGEFTVDEAMRRLLAGSGLTYRYLDEKTITVYPVSTKEGARAATKDVMAPRVNSPTASESSEVASDAWGNTGDVAESIWSRFRLAQVDRGNTAGEGAVAPSEVPSEGRSVSVEEVIVTAQKREERLQDVPIPVTVIDANTLAENNQVRLRDYYSSVPTLSLTPLGEGQQLLSIRGINAGFGDPTVGIMIDEAAFGASTKWGYLQVPDIDPGDLARVEVLRGPQGTLYGANSMGGLIKYVTKDPSFASFSGRIEAGTNVVHNGDRPGASLRGSANVPLSDTLAARMSGFVRRDPGYIDNPTLDRDAVNEADAHGARLSMLWRPLTNASLKLNALYQSSSADGLSQVIVQPGLADLQQNFIPGTSGDSGAGGKSTVQAYSAILDTALGFADLVAISGYNRNEYSDFIDLTYITGSSARQRFGVGSSAFKDIADSSKFTQEVRLSSARSDRFEWVAGGFYTHEKLYNRQLILANDSATGVTVGLLQDNLSPRKYDEYAFFANLTQHVTDRFDVQIGGRESHTRIFNETGMLSGAFYPTPVSVVPVKSAANAFTYQVTPRFKVTPDLMIYMRAASGYRPGGPNPGAAVLASGVPPSFEPDETQNYEVGLKGSFFDELLSVDASVYRIDWKDIQLKVVNPQFAGYQGNGGRAKSEGVELALATRPVAGFTLSGWASYDDAEISDPPPNAQVYLRPGIRLPYGARFSSYLSLDKEFSLGGNTSGYVGGQVNFVGERLGTFVGSASAVRQEYPAYTRTDLRAGVRHGSWTANLYVNNVSDVRGLVGGGIGSFPPFGFIYIQPRTIGLSVSTAL